MFIIVKLVTDNDFCFNVWCFCLNSLFVQLTFFSSSKDSKTRCLWEGNRVSEWNALTPSISDSAPKFTAFHFQQGKNWLQHNDNVVTILLLCVCRHDRNTPMFSLMCLWHSTSLCGTHDWLQAAGYQGPHGFFLAFFEEKTRTAAEPETNNDNSQWTINKIDSWRAEIIDNYTS